MAQPDFLLLMSVTRIDRGVAARIDPVAAARFARVLPCEVVPRLQ
jgi:hypothetical protein